jgi:translin
MKNLDRIAKDIERDLDNKNRVREDAIKVSRDLVRQSKEVISTINKAGPGKARSLVGSLKKDAARLRKVLERYPDLFHSGYVESAYAEVVEACVLHAIIEKWDLPTPRDLNASPEAYLLGLGDVIGELRRRAVDALRKDRLDEAEGLLTHMETLYNLIMRFDYPDALVSLRRKQDVARGVLERTRGEMLVASRERTLKRKLDNVIETISKERTTDGKDRDGPSGRGWRGRRRGKNGTR